MTANSSTGHVFYHADSLTFSATFWLWGNHFWNDTLFICWPSCYISKGINRMLFSQQGINSAVCSWCGRCGQCSRCGVSTDQFSPLGKICQMAWSAKMHSLTGCLLRFFTSEGSDTTYIQQYSAMLFNHGPCVLWTHSKETLQNKQQQNLPNKWWLSCLFNQYLNNRIDRQHTTEETQC